MPFISRFTSPYANHVIGKAQNHPCHYLNAREHLISR